MKQTMVVATKFVIREMRSMNALVNLDLYYVKIRRLVRKVSGVYLDVFVCIMGVAGASFP